MNGDRHQLESLADRARRGEGEAATHLLHLLAPQMIHIVRRTLRVHSVATPLDRRILAEAERIRANHPDEPCQGEPLVRRVAQRLCNDLVRQGAQAGALTHCLATDTVLA